MFCRFEQVFFDLSATTFSAYFKLADGVAGARAFRMSFGEETGIEEIVDGRLEMQRLGR